MMIGYRPPWNWLCKIVWSAFYCHLSSERGKNDLLNWPTAVHCQETWKVVRNLQFREPNRGRNDNLSLVERCCEYLYVFTRLLASIVVLTITTSAKTRQDHAATTVVCILRLAEKPKRMKVTSYSLQLFSRYVDF